MNHHHMIRTACAVVIGGTLLIATPTLSTAESGMRWVGCQQLLSVSLCGVSGDATAGAAGAKPVVRENPAPSAAVEVDFDVACWVRPVLRVSPCAA